MFNDKITVMVVPRRGGELKQFALPIALLWTVGVFCVCFVVLNVFLLAEYFGERVDQARLDRLTRENQLLAQQYADMQETIGGLKSGYNTLVAKEEAIRTIFDLPEIDPEARLLGIGGPEDKFYDSITEATASAYSVLTDVDELLRLSEFERDRYQEVYELLKDKKDLLDHTPSILPSEGYFSSGYGYRTHPFTGQRHFHAALDIANRVGTPVYATANGKVTSVGKNGGLGRMITIDHGYGYQTRFGHLNEFKVKVGQRVKRGDVIGTIGNSGSSTGPHVHYEVIRHGKHLNPYKYILNK